MIMNIMKNKKHIALFGGSFDPPHSGHVVAITVIVKSNLVDEIWLVPAGIRDDKASKVSNDDRKAMISVMLLEIFDAKVPVYMNTTQIDKSWELSTTSGLISEMEMLGFTGISNPAIKAIKNLLHDCIIVDFNSEIKDNAIALKQKINIKLPDAIIAATALYLDVPLFTADKTFRKIPELNCVIVAL